MSLYSQILIATISIPLLLSFDKKLHFSRQWKYIFPPLLAIAICYLAVDILFTQKGIWGFNPRYHSQIVLAGLPIEEYLFFIIVPYASIFLHDSLALYFPKFQLTDQQTRWTRRALLVLCWALAFIFFRKAYTLYTTLLMIVALNISIFDTTRSLNRFFATFLVIMVPFLIVNGLLTGTLIEEEVVWYNHSENINLRILTIPVEDIGYGFSLIYFTLFIREKLRIRFTRHE